MRSHVEFRSAAFPAQPGEERAVNPGRWGKALALFVQTELRSRGVPAGVPVAEDWGWRVPIDSDIDLWVGCGNYDEYPDGFLCFVEPSQPRGRRAQEASRQVTDALDQALRRNDTIRDIVWWPDSA